MNSYIAFQLLETIAAESSRKAKEAFLEEFLESSFFVKMCVLAYDPRITFHILKCDHSEGKGAETFDEDFLDSLRMFSERTVTGNEALETLNNMMLRLDPESGLLLMRILNKDLRAGFNVKSINKVRPLTIFSVPYMRCSLPKEVKLEEWPWSSGVLLQEKMDGMYARVMLDDAFGVEAYTRDGQDISCLFRSQDLSGVTTNVWHNGEILVLDYEGNILDRKTGNGLLNSWIQKKEMPEQYDLRYVVWDVEKDGPYQTRLDFLNDFPGISCFRKIMTQKVHSEEEAMDTFHMFTQSGGEGAIIKHPGGLWKDGTSRQQVKLKMEKQCELRVREMLEGTGRNADTFGSLWCVSEDGLLATAVSGFTYDLREAISKNWNAWNDCIITVTFERVIENKLTRIPSLYLPRFTEKRNEKSEADTLQYIKSL